MLVRVTHRVLFASILAAPIVANAIEWKTDRTKIGRYFDNSEARQQHYFEARVDGSTLSLFRSEPDDTIRQRGLDKVCATVHGFDGVSGLLTKTVNTSFYLINLSKIKSVRWPRTPVRVGDEAFGKYSLTLADGTTLEALEDRNDQLVACGNGPDGKLTYTGLKWSNYKSWESSSCEFDASKARSTTSSTVDPDRAFPFSNYLGRTASTTLHAGLSMPDRDVDTRYGHNQLALEQKFAECSDGIAKLGELKRQLTAEHAARQASRDATERNANIAALDSNQRSLESLQALARAGDAEARALLGRMYLTRIKQGTGNYDNKAIVCLYLASKQGHAGARAALTQLSQEQPAFTRAVITNIEMQVNGPMDGDGWGSTQASCE